MSRAKNPKYESMSLEELKANMEKSRQELEVAIHNKKPSGAEKETGGTQRTFPPADCQKGQSLRKRFHCQGIWNRKKFQEVMNQMRNSSYNKSVVRQNYIAASQKDRQEIAEAVKKTEKGDDS